MTTTGTIFSYGIDDVFIAVIIKLKIDIVETMNVDFIGGVALGVAILFCGIVTGN